MTIEFRCSNLDFVRQAVEFFGRDKLIGVESFDGPDQPVYVTGQLSTALRHLLVKRGRRESFLTTYPVFDCSPHWGFEIFWIVGKHPWAKFFRIDLRQMAYLCAERSEEHTSELQSLMRISYAVFFLKKNT